jgi:hypothetical protein
MSATDGIGSYILISAASRKFAGVLCHTRAGGGDDPRPALSPPRTRGQAWAGSREGEGIQRSGCVWIPAFAGMTKTYWVRVVVQS